MMLPIIVAVATVMQPMPAAASDPDLLIACSSVLGERPERPGLTVTDGDVAANGLKSLTVTVAATGAFMRVHYDAGSERIARARAACLGEQIAAVERAVGDERRGAEWDGVVFTQDGGYIPPRGAEHKTQWILKVEPNGTLDLLMQNVSVNSIPHEQVHAWQRRNGASVPRWVAEGHATWIQRKITPAFDPIVAAKSNRSSERTLAAFTGTLNLDTWGSREPKREAVMRQVSAEDRARMIADPSYEPVGSYTFGPDDFEDDRGADAASYPAAHNVFLGLEAAHGAAAVRAWMTALTAQRGTVTSAQVRASLVARFGAVPDGLRRR